MFNDHAAHCYADLETLTLSSMKKKVQDKFGVSAGQFTYQDEENTESVLAADDDLLHFRAVARIRGDLPMVVEVYADETADIDMYETADAPPQAGQEWTEEEKQRLADFCTSTPWVRWEHVSKPLGRTRDACKRKWRDMRGRGRGRKGQRRLTERGTACGMTMRCCRRKSAATHPPATAVTAGAAMSLQTLQTLG
jgi:hypothetical protein